MTRPSSDEDAIARQANPSAFLRGSAMPDCLRNECLAEIFEATVAARPHHVAMRDAREALTYAEVNRRAEAIAAGLVSIGAGPGRIIGLWMPRGIDLLVAQIAIAKSGAAWLPFDADAPVDRIAVCLDDASALALLTSDVFAQRTSSMPCAVVTTTTLPQSTTPLIPARQRCLKPDDAAYLIYTSGSTGVPKGIVISHRNICHYLRAGNALYGLRPDDVMFQSASVAFDLSMEEIWIPYLVGATLEVATPELLADTDALADHLIARSVTAIDTVPTLLSMFSRDVPSLRLVIFGGEALPPSIIERWAKPGRTIFNTYGPTEATVVATACKTVAGQTVAIGKPIPNYSCYIVDEAMQLCAPGVQGELLIGGPGVACGYFKRAELTAEKFIANPFGSDGLDPILYRSGDAVSLSPDGEILFHGRIDDQVKIRGFRVELGEIETRIDARPEIAQAAVVLRQDDGIDRLVAFLVPYPDVEIDRMALRAALAQDLPAYMLPSRFELVERLPRLSSGKIDRKTLKAVALTADTISEEQEEPRTETEALLLDAAKTVFTGQTIPFDADFFTDLGGHSLLAARFISAVRKNPGLEGMALQDVYSVRTLRAMAAKLEHQVANMPRERRDLSFTPPPLLRRFLCGVGQALALPFILSLMTAQWLGIFVSYMLITEEGSSLLVEFISLVAIYMVINVVTVFIAIAGKWLILGRTKPGRYPLWGFYYYRWWLVQRLNGLSHMKWFQATPIMRLYLMALGAKIGRDAVLSHIDSGAFDLVTIGDNVSIGHKVVLANAEVIGNELVIGTIQIERDAYIGTSCVVGRNSVVGEGAELLDLTSLPDSTRIGAWEKWDGSPAQKIGMVDRDHLPPQADAPESRRRAQLFAYILALLVLPPVSLIPIFPGFYLFDKIDSLISAHFDVNYLFYLPALAWPAAMVMVFVTVLLIAALRWVILPVVRAGTYSVYSWFYTRKWVVALATEVTLETLSSLFATVYMRNWYRLMGAKIGKDAEISSNLAGRYDLTEIGEKSFIADEVTLGDEDIRRGYMMLAPVRTAARVFIGNDGVVPPGADIPEGTLIGIKSKPPENSAIKPGDTWFGSPPIHLPTRQKVDGIGANWTYEPSRWRRLGRGVFEAFNLSLPSMLFITCGTLAVEVFTPTILARDYQTFLLLFLAASVIIPIVMTLVVAGIKWSLMGRYVPTMKPMWSWWAMRTEAIAVMYWGLAGKVLLEHLRGTPFLPWILRVFGAKTGKGVYMDMTDITEFDCVTIGDYCTLNSISALQTHLYEDRVMKVGRVHLGRGVMVGALSTVLYDTHIGDYVRLNPLTVVMKGEALPAHSEWAGAPAIPASAALRGREPVAQAAA